jgi:hypothetical protein
MHNNIARVVPRSRQAGLSIIGLLFFGLIAVCLLLIGFRLVPGIVEYLAVDRAVQTIAQQDASVADLRDAFDRRAVVDNITSISSKDLDITKNDGRVVISYAYVYQLHLLSNVRLVIDFSGSSADRRSRRGP